MLVEADGILPQDHLYSRDEVVSKVQVVCVL